jgi:hypothetical protein
MLMAVVIGMQAAILGGPGTALPPGLPDGGRGEDPVCHGENPIGFGTLSPSGVTLGGPCGPTTIAPQSPAAPAAPAGPAGQDDLEERAYGEHSEQGQETGVAEHGPG